MAARGHNVALISTDPAHSLGDALEMNLAGGNLIDCPLIGVPPNTGSLSVLEIDPSQSINQFKGVVDKLIGGSGNSNNNNNNINDNESGAGIRNTLKELEQVFDTLPAGTDEVVALAKVIHLVKKGGYDRIVIDTAPTGHTLRMLSTPGFLAELIDRLLAIAEKVNSNMAVKMLVAGSAKREEIEMAAVTAKSTLLSFQMQMYDLEDLLADPFQTEFIIVTVPTELAVRESTRLLNDLTFEAPDMPIKVRNVVVNQVLKDDGSDAKTFLAHVRDGQMAAIEDIQSFTAQQQQQQQEQQKVIHSPQITIVPYIDTEPRGVFGLNMLGDELLRE
jgi:arsenite/tail-anchored protein-transporting ATPase